MSESNPFDAAIEVLRDSEDMWPPEDGDQVKAAIRVLEAAGKVDKKSWKILWEAAWKTRSGLATQSAIADHNKQFNPFRAEALEIDGAIANIDPLIAALAVIRAALTKP
jgi:hypothetical protein